MKNNAKNQSLTKILNYIVIKIDYDNKLIMPVEDGMEFMRCWAGATNLIEKYNESPKLTEVNKDFEIKFMTEQAFKEMQLACVIDNAPED